MDVCRIPTSIEAMNKIHDYGCDSTTAEHSKPCLVTSKGALAKSGFYSMHGGSLNGGSNIGALISCSNGTFIFSGVNFGAKDSTGIKGASVLVESTASVNVTEGKAISTLKLYGANCEVDGVKMPSRDGGVALSVDPNVSSSWSLSSGTGSISQMSGYVEFSTATTSAIFDYTVPAAAKGSYVGLFSVDVLDSDGIDKFLQITICRSDGGQLSSVVYSSISGIASNGGWITVTAPIFQGWLIDTQVVRVEIKSYGGSKVKVGVRNLSFFASATVTDTGAKKVISDFCTVPDRFNVKSIDYRSGYADMLVSSVPQVHNASTGDQARAITPASGSPISWFFDGSAWVATATRA